MPVLHGVIIDDRFLIVKVKAQVDIVRNLFLHRCQNCEKLNTTETKLETSLSRMHSSSHNNSQKQFFFTLINDEMSFCTFFTIPRNIYTARRWIVFLQFRYRCNITEMRIDTFANSENIYPMNNKFKGKCTNGISGDLHQPLQWQCIHTCNERLKFGLLSGVLIEIDSLFSSLGELLWKLSVQKMSFSPSFNTNFNYARICKYCKHQRSILRSR